MDKSDPIQLLRRKLMRQGFPAAYVTRTIRELAEHREDLRDEALANGLSADEAEAFSNSQMGQSEALAQEFAETLRRASWWGRHPVVGFVLLPPLCILVWFLAALLVGTSLDGWFDFSGFTSHPIEFTLAILRGWFFSVHYGSAVMVPLLFCWLARRSFCGFPCALLSCLVCSLHGAFHSLRVEPHVLAWGYGVRSPDLTAVLLPLLAFVIFYGISRSNIHLRLIPQINESKL